MASAINPEAGWHAVTADPGELEAAARANERSFEAFAYYAARFGDRGRSFGMSDGAWLLSITSLPRTEALGQIRWLGAMLSSRGIPQLLLEAHLRFLFEELGHEARYEVLLTATNELRKSRETKIARSTARKLADEFDRASGGAVPRFGEVLVAAVADEANGIELAVSSIEGWAADPERFPRRWIAAVRSTIDAARKAV